MLQYTTYLFVMDHMRPKFSVVASIGNGLEGRSHKMMEVEDLALVLAIPPPAYRDEFQDAFMATSLGKKLKAEALADLVRKGKAMVFDKEGFAQAVVELEEIQAMKDLPVLVIQ